MVRGRALDVASLDQARVGADRVERGAGGVQGDAGPDRVDKVLVSAPGDAEACEEQPKARWCKQRVYKALCSTSSHPPGRSAFQGQEL